MVNFARGGSDPIPFFGMGSDPLLQLLVFIGFIGQKKRQQKYDQAYGQNNKPHCDFRNTAQIDDKRLNFFTEYFCKCHKNKVCT